MKTKSLLDILIEQQIKTAYQKKLIKEDVSPDWPAVQKIFTSLGKKPFYISGRSAYKIDDPKKGVIHFYDNGEAYIEPSDEITSWKYKNIGGKEKLTVSGHDIDIQAAVAKFQKYQQNKQQRAQQKSQLAKFDRSEASNIDKLQTALDWLGFIPGFGDILDAINAIIYFARGKNFEGILSAVAVIPALGSPIKASLKGFAEGFNGGAKAVEAMLKNVPAGQGVEIVDFYKMAIDTGTISKLQLRHLADWGDATAALLTKGKRWMQSNPNASAVVTLGNEKALYKEMDKISNTLRRKVAEPADEAASMASRATGKSKEAASKASDWFKTTFNVGGNVVTATGLTAAKNFLRKTFGFEGSKQMKLLKDVMDTRYLKMVSNDPRLLSAMYDFSKLKPGQIMSMGLPSKFNKFGAKKRAEYFKNLKATDPMKWKQVSSVISKNSANADNFYYKKFVDEQFIKASNVFKPGAQFAAGAGDMFSRIFKFDTYRMSNPKNLDIVYNEVSDLMEKMGFDKTDDPNGVVLPAIYMVFGGYLAGLKSAVPSVPGTTPATTKPGATGPGGETGEIPGGTPIETSNSDIMNDFKTANGKTTERLQTLSDRGYSEDQILQLKQELGIE
jgi:hypothetical protein